MTMLDDAMMLMRLLDMEPYPWQRDFWEEYCREPYEQPQLDWQLVLDGVDRLSEHARGSGRTTALAILLAIDDSLPHWQFGPTKYTWVNDHWPTRLAAEMLVYRAMEHKGRWSEFKWLRRPFLLRKEVRGECRSLDSST